jgi:hypothetical protein
VKGGKEEKDVEEISQDHSTANRDWSNLTGE